MKSLKLIELIFLLGLEVGACNKKKRGGKLRELIQRICGI